MSKNIVVLSDGTGNSAAKPFKTNVWRTYQALDQAPPAAPDVPEQVVFYDNGVGTESFKPLALLGGALGIGVWKNVRDLYTFVCRNWQPGEPDDQIYALGFSRGAFTVRLLMAMIAKCGIVKPRAATEAKLLEAVQTAYEAYRRDFLVRASEERWMIYHWFLSRPPYKPGEEVPFIDLEDADIVQHRAKIAFVGVWDTVDAYGMPVDELKTAIDLWVWPMSFADRQLSPRIRVARHALSLDDERPTFRPVLWNEFVEDRDNPKKKVPLEDTRIQQVWFPGVHANVGGGYADDGLAYVSLEWMMKEAEASGLRFLPGPREEVRERANPHGEQYNARSGVAGYYRYGPRRVKELCNDSRHGVEVVRVKVHPSVIDRIERRQVDYAPVSLNCPFHVLGKPQQQAPDTKALEVAWDVVWWRRVAYFATVGLTLFLGLFGLHLLSPELAKHPLQAAEQVLSTAGSVITAPLTETTPSKLAGNLVLAATGVVGPYLGWVRPLVDSFVVAPLTALVSLAVLAWLFFKKSDDLQAQVGARAEWAWAAQKRLQAQYAPKPSWLTKMARTGRAATSSIYRKCHMLIVHLLGVVIALTMAVPIALFGVYRLLVKRRKWLASPRAMQRNATPAAATQSSR
jgi:uncharacterized protein (DUF2235 family)